MCLWELGYNFFKILSFSFSSNVFVFLLYKTKRALFHEQKERENDKHRSKPVPIACDKDRSKPVPIACDTKTN